MTGTSPVDYRTTKSSVGDCRWENRTPGRLSDITGHLPAGCNPRTSRPAERVKVAGKQKATQMEQSTEACSKWPKTPSWQRRGGTTLVPGWPRRSSAAPSGRPTTHRMGASVLIPLGLVSTPPRRVRKVHVRCCCCRRIFRQIETDVDNAACRFRELCSWRAGRQFR
jgi:hypothetical protein